MTTRSDKPACGKPMLTDLDKPATGHKKDEMDKKNPIQRILEWLEIALNHRTSTPHRSETNGIAERAVRRVKEGTSAVLLQSGLDEKWWSDSME